MTAYALIRSISSRMSRSAVSSTILRTSSSVIRLTHFLHDVFDRGLGQRRRAANRARASGILRSAARSAENTFASD